MTTFLTPLTDFIIDTYLVLVSFCSSALLSLDPICLACVENQLRPRRAPVDLPCLACATNAVMLPLLPHLIQRHYQIALAHTIIVLVLPFP
jgi:hypothetical protein